MVGLTFEQITEHRGQEGFIDLDEIFANCNSEREVRGNITRDKIKDCGAMFKAKG